MNFGVLGWLILNESKIHDFLQNDYYLFLEHYAHDQIIPVQHTEKGVRLAAVFGCDEIL